jgi:hypothetical protein
LYRDVAELIGKHNRIKGYPTGSEWTLLVEIAKACEQKALEIVKG